MIFTKELALKGAGALTAASAASAGLYYALGDDKLCEFDRALIEFLRGGEEGKKNDIVFEVKKGTDDFKESDLTFGSSGSSETVKFTVKASIKVPPDATNQTFFTTEGSSTTAANEDSLKNIKELNSNGWTWECNIEFSKTGSNNTLKDEYKNAIFKETNKGLFGILKTKISEQEDVKADNNKWSKYRKVKVEFIKKCGAKRSKETNEEYNKKKGTAESALTITSSPEAFELTARDGSLAPRNPREFSSWFKTEAK